MKIKFIVSGSSSLRILKGSGESLLGRISFHLVLPLTFSELAGREVKANFLDYEEIKKAYDSLVLEKQELLIKLDDYILKGGFPEVFYIEDISERYQRAEDFERSDRPSFRFHVPENKLFDFCGNS